MHDLSPVGSGALRRRWLIVVAAVAILVAVAVGVAAASGVFANRRIVVSSQPALDIPHAEIQARRACADLNRFDRLVKENARGDAILKALATGRREANAATTQDPRWRSLASGADALDAALRTNDARAARVGIDVVRGQCAELR